VRTFRRGGVTRKTIRIFLHFPEKIRFSLLESPGKAEMGKAESRNFQKQTLKTEMLKR
jgi:hypothetical protein